MYTDLIIKTDTPYKVEEVTPVIPKGQAEKTGERKKKRERKKRDEAGKHFESLAQATERAHSLLVQTNSPYRFCVYKESGDVFIDLVVLDGLGKIENIIRKNITHQEFADWMERIEKGDGLFFNKTV